MPLMYSVSLSVRKSRKMRTRCGMPVRYSTRMGCAYHPWK